MKICITLDDVIRAKTKQFGKIYKRGIDNEIELDNLDFSTNNLAEIFHMTKKEYNKFLYEDYPFEIFAEAPVVEKMLDKKLNLWHIKLQDEEDIELSIGNMKEFNNSIGYTCFFLSQIATRVREIHFPKSVEEMWNACDILITAEPELLNNIPEGKIAVKIDTPYNKDCQCSKSYESLTKLLEDTDFISWTRSCYNEHPAKIEPNEEGIL